MIVSSWYYDCFNDFTMSLDLDRVCNIGLFSEGNLILSYSSNDWLFECQGIFPNKYIKSACIDNVMPYFIDAQFHSVEITFAIAGMPSSGKNVGDQLRLYLHKHGVSYNNSIGHIINGPFGDEFAGSGSAWDYGWTNCCPCNSWDSCAGVNLPDLNRAPVYFRISYSNNHPQPPCLDAWWWGMPNLKPFELSISYDTGSTWSTIWSTGVYQQMAAIYAAWQEIGPDCVYNFNVDGFGLSFGPLNNYRSKAAIRSIGIRIDGSPVATVYNFITPNAAIDFGFAFIYDAAIHPAGCPLTAYSPGHKLYVTSPSINFGWNTGSTDNTDGGIGGVWSIDKVAPIAYKSFAHLNATNNYFDCATTIVSASGDNNSVHTGIALYSYRNSSYLFEYYPNSDQMQITKFTPGNASSHIKTRTSMGFGTISATNPLKMQIRYYTCGNVIFKYALGSNMYTDFYSTAALTSSLDKMGIYIANETTLKGEANILFTNINFRYGSSSCPGDDEVFGSHIVPNSLDLNDPNDQSPIDSVGCTIDTIGPDFNLNHYYCLPKRFKNINTEGYDLEIVPQSLAINPIGLKLRQTFSSSL